MDIFQPLAVPLTKYLFFTGKGGVGKTSAACATAVTLADSGKKVLLVSTDPASNLQDVFDICLTNSRVPIDGVPNLVVANLDPLQSAAEYRESVIAPYRGKLPDAVIANMEEQLSGSCTVEIAAFHEFSGYLTDSQIEKEFDIIIFDTAPTGHTIRMLQLPSAWSDFISKSTHGVSCLGQLSGLESKKEVYENAVSTLSDGKSTTMILVTRPEEAPIKEAGRSFIELSELGIRNQMLIINGVLASYDDKISMSLYEKQQSALHAMPEQLKMLTAYYIPLRAYNITGLAGVRSLLTEDRIIAGKEKLHAVTLPCLQDVIEDLHRSGKKVIFTMGKGGVGKTTVAAAIALGLSAKGQKVHLATTDPAAHLKFVLNDHSGIQMSHIDEQEELRRYQEEILAKARKTMSEEDLAYIEEDLRSPCTQEIAVFRAFAEVVEKAEESTVVIDTAPTGHTLLLLDASQSYHREVKRTQGDVPESVKKLLPRLRNADETAVILVTLAETTPVYEAMRLEEDLKRAGINAKWWVINASMLQTNTTNQLLAAKADNEIKWINQVDFHTKGGFAVIAWSADDIKGDKLLDL